MGGKFGAIIPKSRSITSYYFNRFSINQTIPPEKVLSQVSVMQSKKNKKIKQNIFKDVTYLLNTISIKLRLHFHTNS